MKEEESMVGEQRNGGEDEGTRREEKGRRGNQVRGGGERKHQWKRGARER